MRPLPDRRAVLAALVLGAGGCITPRRGPAVPSNLTMHADVGVPNARYWVDGDPKGIEDEALASIVRERAWLAANGHRGPLPPSSLLAISGGGDAGAFGAGLLAGWTQAGDRPRFKMVTGVSTGALIAPFAYLGPQYDDVLRRMYTTISSRDIFAERWFGAALFEDALSSTTPMAKLIERQVTPELLQAIATEYERGRILLVGTTDLDARRPVLWNMGVIAADGSPQAIALFRKILLASAAIPGAFPPVMIDVEVDGRRYQEMHVDGGAMAQVFLFPPYFALTDLARTHNVRRERHLYIIRNARLDPEWASVDRRTLSITRRAISSLIQTQGVGDLYRMYLTARRDGVDYNLAFIPKEFDVPRTEDFDPTYMRALFEYARRQAAAGYPWWKRPPDYRPGPGE